MPRSSRSGWSSWDAWPPSRPLPADGIRARSQRGPIAGTWWSQRFITLLESFNIGARLQRGRRYARAGQVLSLSIEPGIVTSDVQGSRPQPYHVTIRVPVLDQPDWARVLGVMAERAVFLAKLLGEEMPPDIEEAFAEAKVSLFPRSSRELSTDCSCPDYSNPCKHIAATYYLLAEAFGRDPFLIFLWRGRSKEDILSALRTRRAGHRPQEPAAPTAWDVVEDAASLTAVDFWKSGSDLVSITARPRPAASAAAILQQAQPVDLRVGNRPLSDALGPAYERITRAALERALRTSPPDAAAGESEGRAKRGWRVEPPGWRAKRG
jgi:uncharacterized Zn finger protein